MTETIKTLLQPIQDRLNAATPGPWDFEPFDGSFGIYSLEMQDDGSFPAVIGYADASEAGTQDDAAFIAAAPTDQARLLAAVQAVERMAQYLDKLADGDRHYADLFRKAVTDALTEAR
ncbi:hypothetical protein [Paenarthrobacter sp. CAP02]|uniref:hypothetical protein n=1 Tax=Paenarthrobacter sp. CAP02 TaxID=3158144 RepID=UPI0032DB00FB